MAETTNRIAGIEQAASGLVEAAAFVELEGSGVLGDRSDGVLRETLGLSHLDLQADLGLDVRLAEKVGENLLADLGERQGGTGGVQTGGAPEGGVRRRLGSILSAACRAGAGPFRPFTA